MGGGALEDGSGSCMCLEARHMRLYLSTVLFLNSSVSQCYVYTPAYGHGVISKQCLDMYVHTVGGQIHLTKRRYRSGLCAKAATRRRWTVIVLSCRPRLFLLYDSFISQWSVKVHGRQMRCVADWNASMSFFFSDNSMSDWSGKDARGHCIALHDLSASSIMGTPPNGRR